MKHNKKLSQVTDFDLKLFKIFKTVCECRSFTSAESILGISRSAISLHMSDLESRLGIRLCQRGRGGFELTDEGVEILDHIQVLNASIEDFKTRVNELHHRLKGEFNIGLINNLITMQSAYITHTLAELAEENPEVHINISMSTLSDIECQVIDQRLHAGAIPLVTPLASLEYFDLYDEKSSLYCGEGHALFSNSAHLTVAQLKNWQAVMPNYAITAEASDLHTLLNCTAKASDREAIAFLILTGKFLGYLPDHFAQKWLESGLMKPLLQDEMHYTTKICFISKKGKKHNMILQTFAEKLKKIVALDMR